MRALDFGEDGVELHSGSAVDVLAELGNLFAGEPGRRLNDLGCLRPQLIASGKIGAIAATRLGPTAKPVRAIAFDKSPEANWSLGWHQDRTICVARKAECSGYGPWTVKQGLHHVTPPFDLLARMITLCVHLDDVDEANAPLIIALGSQNYGRVAEPDIESAASNGPHFSCLANAGDVWAYQTPILHASERSRSSGRRRVLQLDYSADDLPNPLEWLGI